MSKPRRLRFIFDYDDISIINYKNSSTILDEHVSHLLFHIDNINDSLVEKVEHLKMVNKIIKIIESDEIIFRGRASWVEYQQLKKKFYNYDKKIFSKFVETYPELVI